MEKTKKIDASELWEQVKSQAPKDVQGEKTGANSTAQKQTDNSQSTEQQHSKTLATESLEPQQKATTEFVESKPITTTTRPSPPAVVPPPATINMPQIERRPFPDNLPTVLDIVLGHNGKGYSVRHDKGNLYVLEVGSRALNNIIREIGQEEGHRLRKADLNDINEILLAQAERSGVIRNVWYRVAKIENGVLIDVGDDKHTRIRITAGTYEVIEVGSEILFFRTSFCLPIAMPQESAK